MASAFGWVFFEGAGPLRAIWPSVVTLAVALLLRRVLLGLMAGSLAGVIILAQGNLLEAFVSFFRDHLMPSLQSPWKIGAILFTFMLGGFSALVEKGGGMQALVKGFLIRSKAPARRLQWCAFGMGIVLFFDGLANSMMVGRMMRGPARRCGVSAPRMAYLADSTSSAVACVAFLSTWIAVQLSMIREGYALAGRLDEAAPYALFFRSIPYNFYCWFTLILLAVSIHRNYLPGAMKKFEKAAQARREAEAKTASAAGELEQDVAVEGHWPRAAIPVAALVISFFCGIYFSGTETAWPLTVEKLVAAFGGDHVVIVLVCSSAFGSIVAYLLYPRGEGMEPPGQVFQEGAQALFVPILILVGAWVLSSILGELKAAEALSGLLAGNVPSALFPAVVFLIGALISFSTGSAWGTMILLMPLAIPMVFAYPLDSLTFPIHSLMPAVVGAVFSGAVFGDHCSPISDTTIVSSIACGVEPHDHVRTQMPYALLAASVAILAGFVGTGMGLPPVAALAAGAVLLWFMPTFQGRHQRLDESNVDRANPR